MNWCRLESALTGWVGIAFLVLLGAEVGRGSSWFVLLSPRLDLVLPPDWGACGLKPVYCKHRGQDSWCCPGDCLNEEHHQEIMGCVQWSAAVVCWCPGWHGLSRDNKFDNNKRCEFIYGHQDSVVTHCPVKTQHPFTYSTMCNSSCNSSFSVDLDFMHFVGQSLQQLHHPLWTQ